MKVDGRHFQVFFNRLNATILQFSLKAVMVLVIVFMSLRVSAQLPTGFIVNKLTTNTINEAVAMAHAPDGRIFLAERGGVVKVYKAGVVSTVHTVATTTATEQGLLGITLHPDFATNGKCYIYYTKPDATVHYLDVIVISNTNTVTSSNRIMEFDPIINGFHNGGAMLFKDGYLYICIGESNSQATAVNLNTYMGKVLRLLDDGQPAPGNPYYDEVGANRQKRSIWAIGMRNPWTMSMDPQSKKVFVVNVGGNYEEVDNVTAPDPLKNYNYGWDQNGRSGPDQLATTIAPYFYYGHAGWGCAITTGAAFNPTATNYPAQYRGRFYFTDWCSGWLRSFDINNPNQQYEQFAATGFNGILGLSVGVDGNLYYINYNTNGSLNRIEYTLSTTPEIVNHPESKTVYPGDAVSFSVSSSGALPFTYQWQKNGFDIDGATSSTYTIASVVAGDAANYRCIVSNAYGNATSNSATLTVKPFNAKPVATIVTPVETDTWDVLDVISYSGIATDQEDGVLAASAYQWEVQLFHKDCPTCEHWHPGPSAPSGVTQGSFIADNGGESSSNIWVRLILTVTDSEGRQGKDSVDLHPNKVTLTAQSNVPGLELVIGKTGVVPYSRTFVVNAPLTIEAVSPQTMGENVYEFLSWAHGGAAIQSLRVPSVNTTYTANYEISSSLQNPYLGAAVNIPGRVEFENFDAGGEGISYHDLSAGNAGNGYRTDVDVDIQGANEGGYNLGWVTAGEWLEYTVNVTQSAYYDISFRVSSPNNGRTLHLEIDNENITGSVALPNTGGWQNWQTVTIEDIPLTKGKKIIRLVFEQNDINANYMDFTFISAINEAPTVSIVNPVNDAVFESPASVSIEADANDDGSVTKVEFYNGAEKLGEDNTNPYNFDWTNVNEGNYTITAIAWDDQGLSTISDAIIIEVNSTVASIANKSNQNVFSVFPNPLNDELSVVFKKSNNDATELRVLDIYGHVLLTSVAEAGEDKKKLNVSELPPGVYILQVMDGGRYVAEKFIKM